MDNFVNHMWCNYRPHCGRQLHVEVINNTFDYKSLLQEVGIRIRGWPTSAASKNHVWRFVRRDMLASEALIESRHPGFESVAGALYLIAEGGICLSSPPCSPILASQFTGNSLKTLRW